MIMTFKPFSCCIGTFLVLEILPIIAIVVGAAYWDKERYCTADNIPLMLVIGGVLKVLHLTLAAAAGKERSNAEKYVVKLKSRKPKKAGDDVEKGGQDEQEQEQGQRQEQPKGKEPGVNGNGPCKGKRLKPWLRVVNSIFIVAEFTWFITATVIVYGLCGRVQYTKNVDTYDSYCHPTLFRFALTYITIMYLALGTILIVPLCMCCCGWLSLFMKDDV